jgi:hypothetical protein
MLACADERTAINNEEYPIVTSIPFESYELVMSPLWGKFWTTHIWSVVIIHICTVYVYTGVLWLFLT